MKESNEIIAHLVDLTELQIEVREKENNNSYFQVWVLLFSGLCHGKFEPR